MSIFLPILATIGISLVSLVGAAWLIFSKKQIKQLSLGLMALAAGTMLGSVFLHLLPEATHLLPTQTVFSVVLASLLGFLLIEKIIHWRHCHDVECSVHSFGYMNLLGDAVHNFIDGILIAGSFAVSPQLGLITTLAVAAHEIPQELGDFGVLIQAGFTPGRALLFNLFSASMAIAGAVFGWLAISQAQMLSAWLLPIAAGSFLYISTADLLPEIRKQDNVAKIAGVFSLVLLGVGLMIGVTYLSPEHSHGEVEHSHDHQVEELHQDTTIDKVENENHNDDHLEESDHDHEDEDQDH